MALRATRQYVEILVAPAVYEVDATSVLSLTTTAVLTNFSLGFSAYTEIGVGSVAGLTSIRGLEAANTLVLTGAASGGKILAAVAESNLALTSTASGGKILAAVAESNLALSAAAEAIWVRLRSGESSISLGDLAAMTLVHLRTGGSTLLLDATASVAVVRALAAHNNLTLVHTEQIVRPWYLSAESRLQVATLVYDSELDDFVWQYEGLQDLASVARPVTALTSQSIPLYQLASAVRIKSTAAAVAAESILTLSGEARIVLTGDTGNWLVIQQSATVDRVKRIESALNLSQEAAVVVGILRDVASALAISQAATYSIVSGGVLQQYTPFVGEGPGPTPPPTVLETPDYVGLPFKLFYPAEGSITDYVTLRAPNLGNKDRLSFNRISRETRGGTLIVFADPMWPKIQTLVLSFSGLRSVQIQQFLTFLDTHLGEEIGLLDWEGQAWKGIITAPTEPVVQDGKDSFSASLEFEGELIPT